VDGEVVKTGTPYWSWPGSGARVCSGSGHLSLCHRGSLRINRCHDSESVITHIYVIASWPPSHPSHCPCPFSPRNVRLDWLRRRARTERCPHMSKRLNRLKSPPQTVPEIFSTPAARVQPQHEQRCAAPALAPGARRVEPPRWARACATRRAYRRRVVRGAPKGPQKCLLKFLSACVRPPRYGTLLE